MGQTGAVRAHASLTRARLLLLLRLMRMTVAFTVIELMTLDHTLKGRAINTEQSRRCLFVAARGCEYALDM